MKFLTIKKHTLCVLLVSVILICSVVGVCYAVRAVSSPKIVRTIVIDAGHGGADGGCIGRSSGITENELNLEYAETLKSICEGLGLKVVMTRTDLNGLYSPLASNRKRSDMEARQKIIEDSGADLVLSVHMNAFPLSSSRGAHVFFDKKNQGGEVLAQSLQNALYENIAYAKSQANAGDFYILNCTQVPGALVEFGFLSNHEEEKLLLSNEYRQEICYAVACGVLDYLHM